MQFYLKIFCILLITSCKLGSSRPKEPTPDYFNEKVANHTSIVMLPALRFIIKDTLHVHLAVQYSKQKPFVQPLVNNWFKGTIIENMDSNKVIKLSCYKADKELYKIANKDFNCSPPQRDSILQKINKKCLVEMKFMNNEVATVIYDSSFLSK